MDRKDGAFSVVAVEATGDGIIWMQQVRET
jgi:hypothetical protein